MLQSGLSIPRGSLILFLQHALQFIELALDVSRDLRSDRFLLGPRWTRQESTLESHEPCHYCCPSRGKPSNILIWYFHIY